MRLELERRAERSKAMALLSPIIAVVLTVLASSLIFAAIHHDPFTSGVNEGTGDFVAYAECASKDDCISATEVSRLNFIRPNNFLKNGLHLNLMY